MLGTQLSDLLAEADATAAGVTEALDLVTGFDKALVHGLGRIGEPQAAALAAVADSLATTPLRDRVAEAAGKVAAGSAADEHLLALAGARAALFGAVHDALLARFDAALGRARAQWEPPQAATGDAYDGLRSACRSWLSELAIAGWRGVNHDLVSGSSNVIQALLAEPALRRLAVLLEGLAAELSASSPIATMEHLPVRRWADLWTRAMLLSAPGVSSGVPATAEVSGRLLILGTDIHEHETVVQVQVHGILESAGAQPRLVRTGVAASKVDTITGPAVWRLLQGYPMLLSALAEHRGLEVTDLPLLPSGDLVWHDDRAQAGEPADPFATARVRLSGVSAPATPPLDRHPVGIAEPVLVEGYKISDGVMDLGGGQIAVEMDRLPASGPLTPEVVAASSACIGLIRWDAGNWALQPLAVQATVKRKPVSVHNGGLALDPKAAKAGDAVAILRERAGRLLRK